MSNTIMWGALGIAASADGTRGAVELAAAADEQYRERQRLHDRKRDRKSRKQQSGSSKRKRAKLAASAAAPSSMPAAVPDPLLMPASYAMPTAMPTAVPTAAIAAPTAVTTAVTTAVGIIGVLDENGRPRRRLAPPWMVCACGCDHAGPCPDPQTSDESDSASDAAVPAAVSIAVPTAVQWSEDTDAYECMSIGSAHEHDGWGSDYEDDGSAAGDEALNAVMAAYHRALFAAELVQCGGVGGGHRAVGTSAGAPRSACMGNESEADSDGCCDWHPSWLRIPVSDYEIAKLRTVVENEHGLVALGISPSSQLSKSIHELQHMLTLQSQQQADLYEKVGYAVATAAIFRGLEQYYQSR